MIIAPHLAKNEKAPPANSLRTGQEARRCWGARKARETPNARIVPNSTDFKGSRPKATVERFGPEKFGKAAVPRRWSQRRENKAKSAEPLTPGSRATRRR